MNPSSFLPSLSAVTAGTSKMLSDAKHAVETKLSSRPSTAEEKLPPVPAIPVVAGVQSVLGAEITTVHAMEISSNPRIDENNTAMTNSASTGYLSKLAGQVVGAARSMTTSAMTISHSGRKESCHHCGTEDSRLSLVTSMASQLERCRVCGMKLCPKCIAKVPHLMIPYELLHPDFASTPTPRVGSTITTTTTQSSNMDETTTTTPPTTTVTDNTSSVNTTATTTPQATTTTATSTEKATPPATTTDKNIPSSLNSSTPCWLCLPSINNCEARVRRCLMEQFRSAHAHICIGYLEKYFQGDENQGQYYPKPSDNDIDTPERKNRRMAQVAEVVYDNVSGLTGYGMVLKGLKYAYYGKELLHLLVNADVLQALGPVMEALKEFNISGPNGLLAVYYLACNNDLQSKIDPQHEAAGHAPGDPGLVSTIADHDLIEYTGGYLNVAQWLYLARLPSPHDDADWSAWYLSKVISHQGWTLLYGCNENTKLPDGRHCPAYALAVRNTAKWQRDKNGGNGGDGNGGSNDDAASSGSSSSSDDSDGSGGHTISSSGFGKRPEREALLVIRGTTEIGDWSINMEEDPLPFEYLHKKTDDDRDGYERCERVHGYVHQGMHKGAIGILDYYGLRESLVSLAKRGYTISVVGHSLGAGTAVMVAAELSNTMVKLSQSELNLKSNPQSTQPLRGCVRAIAFACPPVTCSVLSEAFRQDTLCVSIVNSEDPVPRFSRANVTKLASKVGSFLPTARRWKEQDLADVTRYAWTIGKAHAPIAVAGAVVNSSTGDVGSGSSRLTIADGSSGGGNGSNDGNSSVVTGVLVTNSVISADNSSNDDPLDMMMTVEEPREVEVDAQGNEGWGVLANEEPNLAITTASTTVATNAHASVTNDHTSVMENTNASTAMVVVDDSSIPASASASQALPTSTNPTTKSVPLLVPGRIIHLYCSNGRYQAAEISSDHPTLQAFVPYVERGAEDHKMKNYWAAYKALGVTTGMEATGPGLGHSSKKAGGVGGLNPSPPQWQPALCKMSERGMTSTTASTTAPGTASTTASTSASTTAPATESTTGPSSNNLYEHMDHHQWALCAVCEADVTWAYIMHSEATRALVTHNCSLCGRIVCSVCSPAGDKIPGDGVSRTHILKDLRMPLPALGLAPQRVCLHCYLDT